ncbi:aminodeoxychorismate synthase component I [Blastococcus brunescens]|uniref:Aminodeoxychorismate synthase component I n=1 Tax=Blastococcus brunescens TaxID=1564165 RepID=A0ABZ1B4I8_9ACTN|nr:aminodeoxychorismate synthase component I [Blastococcus sp. BMG 8361]WRL65712.1 aminodeoxychorismate synthase component I [Blastococcus sp. BMG 8361]
MPPWRPDRTDAEHARAVATVREHIAAGETYQCNLTDRLRSSVDDPLELYTRLTLAQRGSYNAYLDLGGSVIASASPELFFEWVGSEVRTRPMKGTAARGRTTAEDERQSGLLRASTKEQAENLMIVDLLRNDLGRIAEVGSVRVDELFTLERYPTVWQMTSQVSARLRPDVDLLAIFRALFPCGSVTGAPKQRTMELIGELEPMPRGVYCGAIGLVGPPTAPVRARFSVAIRTAVVDRRTEEAVYGAGGGITWGSDATRERAELHAKAAVLAHPVADHQLLETLAYVPGEGLRNLDRHLARMADSADWFDFRFDRAAVLASLASAVGERAEPARVRLLLFREGRVEVELAGLPSRGGEPVRLALDDDPVDAQSPWLQHKNTRRDVYVTRALRHPEADDVVLINQRGEVTETTIANLAVRLDGRWWTPDRVRLPSRGRARATARPRPAARARAHPRRRARRRGPRRAQLAPGPAVRMAAP